MQNIEHHMFMTFEEAPDPFHYKYKYCLGWENAIFLFLCLINENVQRRRIQA
jgi:hypothetical protein